MRSIDLNCDMGESFGAWKMGNDEALLDHVTSANIACGFHAGDPTTIRKTIELAVEKDVAVGAHPSYPDLQGFGRRNVSMSSGEVYDLVLYQVAAVKGICEAAGARLHHVKPHGALYNQAARSAELSSVIAKAVRSIDEELILYGLAGSSLISEGRNVGLKTAAEVFADRTYQPDGTLTPRLQPDALISDTGEAVVQAVEMIEEGRVKCAGGEIVLVNAETICVHGDGPNAIEFVRALRNAFAERNIDVRTISK